MGPFLTQGSFTSEEFLEDIFEYYENGEKNLGTLKVG